MDFQKKGFFYLMIALLFGDFLHIAAMGGFVYYLDQKMEYIRMPAFALQFIITFTVVTFRVIAMSYANKIFQLEAKKNK